MGQHIGYIQRQAGGSGVPRSRQLGSAAEGHGDCRPLTSYVVDGEKNPANQFENGKYPCYL